MSINFVKKLPIPAETKKLYPLSEKVIAIKKQRDAQIRDVFTGKSDKFLVIIGPCSADNVEATLDYTHRLAKVQDKVGDRLILIPRLYEQAAHDRRGLQGTDAPARSREEAGPVRWYRRSPQAPRARD